jgi:hypothetical protein
MSGDEPGDVQSSLNELERKLRELQAELGGPTPPAQEESDAPAPPPMPPYRPPAPPEPPPPAPPPAPEPAGGLQAQLDELLRFRDQLAEAAKALVEDYSRVLEQIERAVAHPAPPPPPPPPPPTPATGHVTFPVPPPAAPSTESALYSGHVAIDAGPFPDIATVAAFEESLRRVPHAEDVYVRSFEGHRALLELRLAAEVPLVFELRRASDHAFDVDHADPGRLTLTMHAGNPPIPNGGEAD